MANVSVVLSNGLSPLAAQRAGLEYRDYNPGETVTVDAAVAARLTRAGYVQTVGVTIGVPVGGSTPLTIYSENTPLTQRTKLKFTGAGVTTVDDAVTGTTVVTIPGGGGSGGAVSSVAGRTGAVVLTAADVSGVVTKVNNVNPVSGNVTLTAASVGADATGTAAGLVNALVGQSDPFPQYLTVTEGDGRYALVGSGGGGGSASGPGPNWVASSTAPAAIRNAVAAAGGAVCDGTADQVELAAALVTYKAIYLTEGVYNLSASLAVPAQHAIFGAGQAITRLRPASGLTGSIVTVASDWVTLGYLGFDGNGVTAHGIEANITSQTGFYSGADANLQLHNLLFENVVGDGIRMIGNNAREAKLRGIHIHNASGRGIYGDCPDVSIEQVTIGTAGSHGVELTANAASWHFSNVKSWYSAGDGYVIRGARHYFSLCEAQDNQKAGFRVNASNISLTGCIADSNSWVGGNANASVYSGFEIGRTEAGGTSGGFGVQVTGGQSWDKNETSRGRAQRSGIRIRTGARRINVIGFNTGAPTDTHCNTTAGVECDTASDKTHAENAFFGTYDHGTMLLR